MKEQTRNTKVQINEAEIGKLPEKIQNNDSKDDQKPWKQNGENARINKKGLEELKNKHTETNNKITEITPEGNNSRISEAEARISELEDKMVEITYEEQNKVKRMKELRIVSETSETISNTPTFEL